MRDIEHRRAEMWGSAASDFNRTPRCVADSLARATDVERREAH
jgi:hypothetical protein